MTDVYRMGELDHAMAVQQQPPEDEEDGDEDAEPTFLVYIAAKGCGLNFTHVFREALRGEQLDRDAARAELARLVDTVIEHISSSVQRDQLTVTAALEEAALALPTLIARHAPRRGGGSSYKSTYRSTASTYQSYSRYRSEDASDAEEGERDKRLCFDWADKQCQFAGAEGCRFTAKECKWRHTFKRGEREQHAKRKGAKAGGKAKKQKKD